MNLTLGEVARIVGGHLLVSSGPAPDAWERTATSGVCVDSRLLQPGELFVALPGGRRDGHEFVAEALRAGAAGALVSRPVHDATGPVVGVADPMGALRHLAAYTRDVADPLVVAITGSTGKTSTKDLLAAVASVRFTTVASERSFNNELGVPLTLLKASAGTQVLVCEMGARGPGQIAELCSYVRPHIGVVTNVGVTHFEQFGSAEAILAAKTELPASLPVGGVAVLNADDPGAASMSCATRADVVTYGTAAGAWVRAESIDLDRLGRPGFRLVRGDERVGVQLQMAGRHQVSNALAAAAAGLTLGLSLEEVRAGLQSARSSPWRMDVVERSDGVIVVNDAYNANPTSMAAALASCSAMVPPGGRLMAVLGMMAELGAIEVAEHERVGAAAAAVVERLVAVGERARPIAVGARRAGLDDVVELPSGAGAQSVADALGRLGRGDVVLVKASRSGALEEVALLLGALAEPGHADGGR